MVLFLCLVGQRFPGSSFSTALLADPGISILLQSEGDAVRFVYQDNGVGFETEPEDGPGTTILKGFARSVEGQLDISGSDGYRAEFLRTVKDDDRFK